MATRCHPWFNVDRLTPWTCRDNTVIILFNFGLGGSGTLGSSLPLAAGCPCTLLFAVSTDISNSTLFTWTNILQFKPEKSLFKIIMYFSVYRFTEFRHGCSMWRNGSSWKNKLMFTGKGHQPRIKWPFTRNGQHLTAVLFSLLCTKLYHGHLTTKFWPTPILS